MGQRDCTITGARTAAALDEGTLCRQRSMPTGPAGCKPVLPAAAPLRHGSNSALAKRALEYVKQKMTIGAGNNRDVISTFGASFICVAAIRSVDFEIWSSPDIPWEMSEIMKMAAKAEHVGCGNCGEQAALAFVYLSEELKVRPLDFMSRTNADHAFVVIGRRDGSEESDYKTWGDGCVICDPWDSKVYPAAEIPTKAYKAKDFLAESIFRRS